MSCFGLILALALAGEPGRVARLELPVPGHSPFVLHGTLPLPREFAAGPDGRPVLFVESHDALHTLVPAQVEIVSRASDGKPDVVELLARVELGPQEHEGGRTDFSVRQGAAAEAVPFRALPAVEALLARGSKNLALRAEDVFGNVYQADLCGDALAPSFGSLRLSKDGRCERELRLAATLVPLEGPAREGAPLPHLMGVQAFLRARAGEEVVGLDLRVHNGCSSGSRPPESSELPVGALYWRSLELLVPREWNALSDVVDPFCADAREEGRWRVIPLVKPLPGGKLHLLPPQSQFVRRLALVPAGKGPLARDELAQDGLAFALPGEKLWSWFAPECARWLAQRAPLPRFEGFGGGSERGLGALRAMESAREQEYARAISSGKPSGWNTIASVMGWCHPWFPNSQFAYGSEGLELNDGAYTAAGASREGYLCLQHLQRMNVCRQSEAAWTRAGDPAGYPVWLDAAGGIRFEFRQDGSSRLPGFALPCNGGPAANAQVPEVVRRELRPPYDLGDWYDKSGSVPERIDNVLAWRPHSAGYMLRYTKVEKALVWLGNDSLAKDDLLLSAELFHLAFHESPGAGEGGALRACEQLVKAHPHQGADIGRGVAFGIDVACAAYSVAPPVWRERNRGWLVRIARLCCDAALPSGIVQRSVNPRVLGNEYYTVTQTFESLLLIHGLRCLDESVLRGVDEARRSELERLVLRAVDYLYWGAPFERIAADWQPDPRHPTIFVQGPRFGFAISRNDDYKSAPLAELPPECRGGGIESTHGLWVLEWARELSDPGAGKGLENRYLRRALDYGLPHKDFGALMRDLEAQTREFSQDNSGNWAPFLAALQQLGVR